MPMTYEKFKKRLAEQGGVLPSPWVQQPPALEEMVPWADPVKRGVATPDLVAEQARRDEMMHNAEIKPMSKNPKAELIAKQLDDLVNYDRYRTHNNETYMKEWKKIFDKKRGLTSEELNKAATDFGNKFEADIPQRVEKLKKQLDRLNKPEKNIITEETGSTAPVISLEEYLKRKGKK